VSRYKLYVETSQYSTNSNWFISSTNSFLMHWYFVVSLWLILWSDTSHLFICNGEDWCVVLWSAIIADNKLYQNDSHRKMSFVRCNGVSSNNHTLPSYPHHTKIADKPLLARRIVIKVICHCCCSTVVCASGEVPHTVHVTWQSGTELHPNSLRINAWWMPIIDCIKEMRD
jgi:hypothetical protein